MDWGATYPETDNQEEICNNCGAKYRVRITTQKGHNDSEEYQCPECGKIYTVWASITPNVELISGRTDGKTDKYDNTVWLQSRGHDV